MKQHNTNVQCDKLKASNLNYKETVGEKVYNEREHAFMQQNHAKYLGEQLMIGFTHSFPEHKEKSKIIDEMTVTLQCQGQEVTLKVRYGAVTFGKKDEYSCSGITTDRLQIKRQGPMAGWGSHSYLDEAAAMERAVILMATKHRLMICDKRCSWPHAKAIVQPIEEAHVKHFDVND